MIQVPFRALPAAFQVAGAQNASLLGIIVAAKPSRGNLRVLIDRIYCRNTLIAAGTGVGIELSLRRLTALTVGSGAAGSVVLLDKNLDAGSPPTDLISCFTLGTATAGDVLDYLVVNNDEVPATTRIDADFPIWEPAREDCPIVLEAGTGLDILHVTDSTVGRFCPVIDGRIEVG